MKPTGVLVAVCAMGALLHGQDVPRAVFRTGTSTVFVNVSVKQGNTPVSGLDVSTALVLRSVVRSLAADGRIIVYSSHELDTIERISTRVMILRAGEVVADDSAARLRELVQAPSLEDVFSQLAGQDDLQSMTGALLEAVRQ